MKTVNVPVTKPELGMKVYHEWIYNGNEKMEVVGIRKDEVELRGDYSGGTHNVDQKSWMPLIGTFRKKQVCEQIEKFGSCQLHNLHCNAPDCEPYI